MTSWGYARVSTVDQDLGPQLEALARAGVDADHVVVDRASGARQDRPGLTRLLDALQEGDVLTVWKLDRLGRSLSHLVHVVTTLGERGVQFRSVTESLDTTTASGRLLFHVVGAVAEFERDLVRERTRNALAAAKASGKPLGRPSKVTAEQFRLIHQMTAAGASQKVIAATTGLSRPVVGRVVRREIASVEGKYTTDEVGELPLYRPAESGVQADGELQ